MSKQMPSVETNAKAVLLDARQQKLATCIMAMLKATKLDNKNLALSSEVKDARTNGVDEKKALPKCVMDKLNRAMQE